MSGRPGAPCVQARDQPGGEAFLARVKAMRAQEELEATHVNIGDRVLVRWKFAGTVRYKGAVLYAPGLRIGVEVSVPLLVGGGGGRRWHTEGA